MFRLLHLLIVPFLLTASVAAQEIPGVRVTLVAPSLFSATADVQMRLTMQVDEDVELPAVMLTGLDLVVRIDGEEVAPIQQPAKGDGAPVAFTAGTRIDRLLTVPARKLLAAANGGGEAAGDGVRLVAVAWRGIVGADCAFKVAPDTTGINVDDLDLSKTEVVLVTNFGDMRLGFRPDKAPKHVRNFVKLCLQGFYDGTRFHRVIQGFMIQGGCPHTKDESKRQLWGTGGAGYTVDFEGSDLRHLKGTLSMARSPDNKDSASSGFFIVHRDASHLDGQYSAFGNVLEGIDTLERIANVPCGGPKNSIPLQPVILQSAIVLARKKH